MAWLDRDACSKRRWAWSFARCLGPALLLDIGAALAGQAPPGATAEATAEVATEPSPEASAPAPAESAAVAARFPDPDVRYRTPAFEPGHDGFTSNAELRALLRALVQDGQDSPGANRVSLLYLGSSQTGVPLEALRFTRGADAANPVSSASSSGPASTTVPGAAASTTASTAALAPAGRPTVLLIGQQHGDEPAGAEALIVIAQELAQGRLQSLLDQIDVLILPRANPDGAALGRRLTASGIDMNRDHLLLRTPEAQAVAQLAREYRPIVVVDAHEFPALGLFNQKFRAVPRYDMLAQYAMTANLPEFVTRAAAEWFYRPMLQSLKAQGLSTEWYHTTSTQAADAKVSMGGVQPDSERNVAGLRNAVSLLIETRGAGLGSAHLLRRVHTQVTAIASVLASAAARAADLQKLRRFVDADVAAKACQGAVTVEAAATPGEYELQALDPVTGADKRVTVAWDSALVLVPVKVRPRPCGYWLGADQTDAVLRLRGLGVQVQRVEQAGALRGEAYTETARMTGPASDVRDRLADGGSVLRITVARAPALIDADAGSYYVGLDQPLANLVVAALEPDTQNSYLANRVVSAVTALARVLRRPEVQMSSVP